MDWYKYFVCIIKQEGIIEAERIPMKNKDEAKQFEIDYNTQNLIDDEFYKKYPREKYVAIIHKELILNLCKCGNKPSVSCRNSVIKMKGKAVDVVICEKCQIQSEEFLCNEDSYDNAINAWNKGNIFKLAI